VRQKERVYAWEFPVRLTHWVNVLCIVAFAVTGLYIGSPYVDAQTSEQYIMGWMRFLHFVAGYTFLMSFIIRLYWLFMGNRFASWRMLFPFTAKQRELLVKDLQHLLLIRKGAEHTAGHTVLGGLTYLVVFLLFAFEIVSGFALYSLQQPGVWAAGIGAWLLAIMDAQTIRLWHHMVMYFLLAFTLVHVYMAWWHDTEEQSGVMTSIFGGYKFMPGKEGE
jgi:Ni/Fe-hydrogenase 1 B-type cytochrome subunit